ncbi:MAG TPA: hypothetical protein VGF77_00395 [Allosphingosinicella sp.]|jgi:hypothetical protein
MERTYWLSRERASVSNARRATSAQSRLVHLDLAGRYSIKAALVSRAPARPETGVSLALPQPNRGDAEHYRQLEMGARWLASRSSNDQDRHEHLAMATKYSRLRLEAADDNRR